MTTLLDRTGKPCAYLYNNKILLATSMEVAGVTLGDCVFGISGDIKGKIFNKTLYTLSGEVVAQEQQLRTLPNFDLIDVLMQGWTIVEKITDHRCPWINPSKEWFTPGIEDFLTLPANTSIIKVKDKKLSLNYSSPLN